MAQLSFQSLISCEFARERKLFLVFQSDSTDWFFKSVSWLCHFAFLPLLLTCSWCLISSYFFMCKCHWIYLVCSLFWGKEYCIGLFLWELPTTSIPNRNTCSWLTRPGRNPLPLPSGSYTVCILWASEFASQLKVAREEKNNNSQTKPKSPAGLTTRFYLSGKEKHGRALWDHYWTDTGRQEKRKTQVSWVSSLKASQSLCFFLN